MTSQDSNHKAGANFGELKGLATSSQVEITQAGRRITREKIFLGSPRDADAAILYPNNNAG